MKEILITGGAGFIGFNTVDYFSKYDDIEKIHVIDNLSREQLLHKDIKNYKYNWNCLKLNSKVKLYQKDVCDFPFMKKIFKNNTIDVIIHTAAQTAVTTSILDPLTDFKNNLIGTFYLLESIRLSNSNPVVILTSTNKVFGNNVNKCEVREENLRYKFSEEYKNGISEQFPIDLCEHTPYGTSKLCSDLYFQEYGHLYGLKTGVFRMSCIYGPYQFGVEDQGWVSHFIISAIKDKILNIYGDGKQVRDVLYVSDLIKAFDLFIQHSKEINHDVFCIGGGKNNTLSLLELIKILEDLLKKKIKYEFLNWRPSDQKVYISDIQKANEILGWNPEVNPEDGVKKLLNWVLENKNIF